MQIWGDSTADFAEFSTRVQAYFALRNELERGLPPQKVTDDTAATRRRVHALAERVRAARAGAKRGDIFTPAISTGFKKVLLLQSNPETWASLADDNPGEFATRINSSYPEKIPFSTVPANILAVLPILPDDIQYRFLGHHLILLDTRSGVILDRISDAIEGPDCEDKRKCHR